MPLPVKPQIAFADLERVDIRVGRILALEDVAGSEKLVALRVGFGDFERTILVGMKLERADPGALRGAPLSDALLRMVGRQALFVVNLAPRTMFGIVSEGMLFDIGPFETRDGRAPQDDGAGGLTHCLAVPERDVPDGTGAG